MDNAIDVVTRYTFWDVLKLLAAIVVLVGIAVVVVKKVYGWLEEYRKKRNGIENKDRSIEERVAKLEASDREQLDKLHEISAGVQQLAATLDTMATNTDKRLTELDKDNKRRSVITNRSTLYRLHSEFMAKQFVTLAEREMFDAVAAEYLECGGNSIFRSKIIPEVEALPIKN